MSTVQYTPRLFVLSSDVLSPVSFINATRLYLYVEVHTESDKPDAGVHIVYRDLSLCIHIERIAVDTKFYISMDGFYSVDKPTDAVYYVDVGPVQVDETARIYALGYLTSKSYSYSFVTDYQKVNDQNIPYRYLAFSMVSEGYNSRYGVRLRGIIGYDTSLYFEHVHTDKTRRKTDVVVKLMSNKYPV